MNLFFKTPCLCAVWGLGLLSSCNTIPAGTQGGVGEDRLVLISAAKKGDVLAMERGLLQGLDIQTADGMGTTALHAAAAGAHVGVVRCLLSHGAELSVRDRRGNTPLMCVGRESIKKTATEIEETTRLLVEAGSTVNADNRGSTALMNLLELNGVPPKGEGYRAARYLAEHGADIRRRDGYGMTPLMIAVLFGQEKMVKVLLDRGVDVNSRSDEGDTALILATFHYDNTDNGDIRQKMTRIMNLLITSGADVKARNDDRDTAGQVAKRRGYSKVAALLEKTGISAGNR